jgi:shikimate dehydrogenase
MNSQLPTTNYQTPTIFGLIGYPLSHSFSQKYFTEKFAREGIDDALFENFSIPSVDDISKIIETHPSLKGMSVTIPYKRSIINFLDKKSNIVEKINACNCIKIEDGKLTGFNTDVIGFEKSFVKKLQPYHQKALILGTGGAASAVEFVLNKLKIDFQFVSRTKKETAFLYGKLNEEILSEYQIIINCSPVGTFPNVDEAPEIPYQYISPQHYLFDLVYNPAKTKFLLMGEKQKATIQNGYEMLVLQAEENWRIWNE